MNWEKKGNAFVHPGFVQAEVCETVFGWDAVAFVKKHSNYLESEQEAKEWAEARMNEIKKEFILSMIVKFSEDSYMFGKDVMQIIGGYDGKDKWTVYGMKFTHLFQGTLEECKNYIISCFC